MSMLFGEANRRSDIASLVEELVEGGVHSLCNENVAGSRIYDADTDHFMDGIKSIMNEHYSKEIPEALENILTEDTNVAAKMFLNNLTELSSMNENAALPVMRTLTASIATIMRTPYEAVMHRVYDTQVIDKQAVEIETVIPTIKAPGDTKVESLVDAFAPDLTGTSQLFVDRTEIMVTSLTDGVVPGVKNVALLNSMNPLFRINGDVRVTGVDASIDVGGTPTAVDADDIKFVRGTVPYFNVKDFTVNCMFEITDRLTDPANPTVINADVSAKIDFATSTLEYLRADSTITKVYFYATVSHAEHTHPITTGFTNRMEQYIVPTRPHIEVTLPQETKTDIANSIQHFSQVDIVTAMTENITVISSRMEDQRLLKGLKEGNLYEATFKFMAPDNFAYGNLEWLKREFIPFLDQCSMKMRNNWNITDCHFRVAVSPYILRILDTDYSMDKSLTKSPRVPA